MDQAGKNGNNRAGKQASASRLAESAQKEELHLPTIDRAQGAQKKQSPFSSRKPGSNTGTDSDHFNEAPTLYQASQVYKNKSDLKIFEFQQRIFKQEQDEFNQKLKLMADKSKNQQQQLTRFEKKNSQPREMIRNQSLASTDSKARTSRQRPEYHKVQAKLTSYKHLLKEMDFEESNDQIQKMENLLS